LTIDLIIRPRRRRLALAAFVALGIIAASCAETASPQENREAAIYTTVIRFSMAAHPPAAPENPDELPAVFVESLTPDIIPIEVQVEVIDRLVDEASIRFTDSRAEAVDEDDPTQPVQAGSILIGLGAIPDGSQPVMRVEIYQSLEIVHGYLVAVVPDGVDWKLDGEPEVTEAEGLIVVED
jgi:hypothetical protein